MKEYKIRVTEHFEKVVVVPAKNEEQALQEAQDIYEAGGYDLSDFSDSKTGGGVEFDIISEVL